MSEPVELRCGMCDGSGVDDQPDRGGGPQACWMCDGTATVVAHLDGKYVAVDYVESAIAFLRWPDLDWAERCARAENELLAAINAVTGEA